MQEIHSNNKEQEDVSELLKDRKGIQRHNDISFQSNIGWIIGYSIVLIGITLVAILSGIAQIYIGTGFILALLIDSIIQSKQNKKK